jgi:acetylcholinesterase
MRVHYSHFPPSTSRMPLPFLLCYLCSSRYRTDEQLSTYLNAYWFRNASDTDVANFMGLYPQDITRGSPFNTGSQNAVTPQYKRIASLQGDLIFQAPRRLFMHFVSDNQNQWAYCKHFTAIGM